MVGDDSPGMTQEMADQGVSAICCRAPGFKGGAHAGYENALDAIINSLPDVPAENADRENPTANVLGVLPVQDIHWLGNLAELSRIFGGIGVRANVIFGPDGGVGDFAKIPSASLNAVASKWGLRAARALQDKYGTPYIYLPDAMMGNQAEVFVREAASRLGISPLAEDFIAGEREYFLYAMSRISDYYYDWRFQRKTAIVGDESSVVRYRRFFSEDLGIETVAAIATDGDGEAGAAGPGAGKYAPTHFSADGGEIDELIAQSGAEFVLGSGLENGIASRLGVPNYVISYPAFGRVIIGRSDIGWRGAVSTLECMAEALGRFA
jgi:nitrogenase molybdenum-iron protein beta chain